MGERAVATGATGHPENHFGPLLIALVMILIGYPYFGDSRVGAFLGGVTALLALMGAVYAVRTNRFTFRIVLLLALATAGASVSAFLGGVRGHPVVEATFSVFYGATTVAVFFEVIRTRRVTIQTMYGTVCVYLLVGMTFGNLFDLIETLHPGSFQVNVDTVAPTPIGWRTLIFFSFMTLTTIGLGDVTPATTQTQSLTAIEGVMGVLYVAVLIARTVGIYSGRSADE